MKPPFLASVQVWVEESIAYADKQQHAVLVATDAERVVGFVSLSDRRHFTGEVDGYIGELVVAADFEGRGVARQLLSAAECWAMKEGLRSLTLETGARNTRARLLYEALGYEYEDVRLTKLLPRSSTSNHLG